MNDPSHQKQVAFSRASRTRTARGVAANSAPQYHAVDFGPSCRVRGDPEPILKPLRARRRKRLRVISRAAAKPDRPRWRKVAEIMTQNVITVTADTPLDGIVQLMERRRIKRVPVIEGDALVGIVSRADPSDEEILEQIHAELAKVVWVLRDGLSITVKGWRRGPQWRHLGGKRARGAPRRRRKCRGRHSRR